MKFYEFGTENDKKLVLIHGMSTTWKIRSLFRWRRKRKS